MKDPVAESTASVQPVGRMLSLVNQKPPGQPESFQCYQSYGCTLLLSMLRSELHPLVSTVKTSSRLCRSAAASQQPSSRCEQACSCGEAAVQDAQSCDSSDSPMRFFFCRCTGRRVVVSSACSIKLAAPHHDACGTAFRTTEGKGLHAYHICSMSYRCECCTYPDMQSCKQRQPIYPLGWMG